MYPIKQSTAITIPFYVHDANGDAVTGLTDGSFTKRISKGSAVFGAMTVTITEMENGWYSIPLSTSHSDTLNILTVLFTNAGAKQVNLQFRVTAKLIDDLNDLGGTAQTADHTAAIADIPTVTEFNARTLVAASYFDSSSDSVTLAAVTHTGATIPNVTLVATTTTNTDMRGTDSANTVVPASVAQFNARSILSADYFLVTDYTAPDNAGITSNGNAIAALNDIAATDVWSSATRVLTAGTNIVLAKGVGLTGLNDIAATAIVTGGAITTASGNANVNAVKINGTTVIGAGTAGNLWRA